ncbi:hypothetical protein Ahy_A03g015357 [Arachis hypogaea]|uniref:Transposase MuDR plant domain-containing protein n=1 Tax=Arachis hypogaea TaxID=3818 RepID=A0A445E093_ARAHY|nr:hypothetical protein Ahy_A03g015357 [Arachis hypogaea]
MHALEFTEYVNIGIADLEDGEFRIGLKYSSRKSIVVAIRSYTISRRVNYNLIRASLIRKKGCWEIRRYNGRHTCTIGTISQDHSKLNSDIVVEAIRPLVETDPSMKKSRAKVFGGWEESQQAFPWWFSIMVQKRLGSIVQIET